jgi:hypothetical protein
MTLPRLRTRLAVRLLCAGFVAGFAPSARAQAPDDTGYDRYRGQAGAPGDAPTRVARAWQDVKKWASDRGTGFTKSFAENGPSDPSLMPLTPAILPEFANGNRTAGVAPQPTAAPPNAFRAPPPPGLYRNSFPPAPPLAKHPQSPYAFGGGPVMAGPQGTTASPAQLAGKPAYNWYGYGSAPATGSPQASANWIAQTGATAGAFPVTAAGTPRSVPPPSAPGFVGGPKAVSMIPTLPTITPPPPAMPVATQEPPSGPALKAIPTVTPSASNPTTTYTAPAVTEAPVPKPDEPEWQPAARRPFIEQTAGKADGSRVVTAVATEASDSEPAWQTAPAMPKRPTPTPVVKTIDRPPALLPVPIPAAPAGVPVIETVSTAPVVTVPVVTAPSVTASTVASAPALIPVPVPPPVVPQPPPPQPQAQPQTAWQATAGYQAPQRQPVPTAPPTTPPRPVTMPTVSASFPAPLTTGRPSSRPTATTPPVPATMANGLAPPPPDAPAPRAIPVAASREVLDLERQIRAVTVRTATILEVNEVAPQKYVVKYVSKSEPAARDAAAAISALPALRPFAIDFEVRLAGQ